MPQDFSKFDRPVDGRIARPDELAHPEQFKLSAEQVAFFEEHGYLAGVKILDDEQVDQLRDELATLVDSKHPSHDLFYEYHSNESADPSKVLFHALGAWRITHRALRNRDLSLGTQGAGSKSAPEHPHRRAGHRPFDVRPRCPPAGR